MFGQGHSGLSIHSDVLNAEPVDDDSKLRLIDEIKRRAVASMKSKNYPEAIALYTKAVEICPDSQANAKAILFSNRSAARAGMANFAQAVDDANESIATDPSYLKGYFRKATALVGSEDFSAAKEALIKGLEMKPDDPDFRKLLAEVEEKAKNKASSKKSINTSSSANSSSKSNSSPAPAPSSSTPKATGTATKPDVSPSVGSKAADEEEDGEAEAANMRGYKLTADGRKTTFFNRELDEQTKALIGSIAPQKLDAPAAVATDSSKSQGGASAWNTAGTFEAVDHCKSHCTACPCLAT
jgi:tetratricopeptide (TPR) repeat protein